MKLREFDQFEALGFFREGEREREERERGGVWFVAGRVDLVYTGRGRGLNQSKGEGEETKESPMNISEHFPMFLFGFSTPLGKFFFLFGYWYTGASFPVLSY